MKVSSSPTSSAQTQLEMLFMLGRPGFNRQLQLALFSSGMSQILLKVWEVLLIQPQFVDSHFLKSSKNWWDTQNYHTIQIKEFQIKLVLASKNSYSRKKYHQNLIFNDAKDQRGRSFWEKKRLFLVEAWPGYNSVFSRCSNPWCVNLNSLGRTLLARI